MPEHDNRPRPHGDPLREAAEPNAAQRQSDAPDAGVSGRPDELTGSTDRDEGKGSTANGIPASDEDAGNQRRKQYEGGADLVSRID